MCYVWRLPHIYEVTMFPLHKNRYTYHKVSSYTGLNGIFDWIRQPQFSYRLIGLALAGTCRPSCSSSLLDAYKLNETWKLLTFNFISKLLQRGKNMATFCSTVHKFHWLFCAFSNLDCVRRSHSRIYIYCRPGKRE